MLALLAPLGRGLRGTSWLDARGTLGYLSPWMGLSATGDNLLSSDNCFASESSSGVGSSGSAVSKEVWDETESRKVGRVDVFEIVRDPAVREPVVLDDGGALRTFFTGRVSESCRGVMSREGGGRVLK